MGNRGEDAYRDGGAWGRQPPRQSSSGTGAGGAGAWDDRSRGYWQDDDYPRADGAGYGYGPDDGYPAQDPGYGQNDRQYGRNDDQYGQYGAGSGTGYGRQADQGPLAGYGPGGYAQQPGYRSGGQPRADGGYRQSGGYPALPPGSGGYREQGSGGYPEQDAGNDWYSGQPAAANGASFADTGTYRLNGRIIDEYGTGPRGALRDGDHGQGYPPAAGKQGHGTSGGYPAAGDDYDDYGGGVYQAPGGYGDPGHDGYGQPARYEGASDSGYDGYGDYGTAGSAYGEGYDGEADSRGRERGGRGGGGRGSGARRLLLAALAVVMVGIAGVAAYVFVLKPKSTATTSNVALPTGSAEPSSQQACEKQLGTYCRIELRSEDPTALTTTELFPPAFKIEADKISYQLVSTKVDKTCSNAVIGADIIKALKNGKCTQVLRATYVSGDGKIMGTIGVVNLVSTTQAHYAGKVVGQSDFIAPLTTAKGVTAKLGKGTGVVEAQFKGHYLILSWSEFVDGTTPTTSAQDKQLEQFGNDLVSGTANISLTQRMVTGAPPTNSAAS